MVVSTKLGVLRCYTKNISSCRSDQCFGQSTGAQENPQDTLLESSSSTFGSRSHNSDVGNFKRRGNVVVCPGDSQLGAPTTPMYFQILMDFLIDSNSPKRCNGGFPRCGTKWEAISLKKAFRVVVCSRKTRWWQLKCFILATPTRGDDPIERTYFSSWVETTNYQQERYENKWQEVICQPTFFLFPFFLEVLIEHIRRDAKHFQKNRWRGM